MSKHTSDEPQHLHGGGGDGHAVRSVNSAIQADPDLFSGLYLLTLSTSSALVATAAAPLTAQVHSVNNVGPTYGNRQEYWSLSPDFLSGLGRARVNQTTLTFAGSRSPGPFAPMGFPAPDANPLFSMPAASPAWGPATLPSQGGWFQTPSTANPQFAVHFDGSVPPVITWYQHSLVAVTPLVSCAAPTTLTYVPPPSSPTGWLQLAASPTAPTLGKAGLSSPVTAGMLTTSLAFSGGLLLQACLRQGNTLSVLASNDGCTWADFLSPATRSSTGPAIASLATGEPCLVYVESTDPETILIKALKLSYPGGWSPTAVTVGSGRAPSAPALATLDGKLFAAFQDGGRLTVCSTTRSDAPWTQVQATGLPAGALGAPALAALPGSTSDALYLATALALDLVVFSSTDGTAWTQVAKLPPSASAPWIGGVALATYNGTLYLAATSSSGLQVMQSLDGGLTWSESLTSAWANTAGAFNPAMSALSGSLLVLSYVTGTAPTTTVNYAYLR